MQKSARLHYYLASNQGNQGVRFADSRSKNTGQVFSCRMYRFAHLHRPKNHQQRNRNKNNQNFQRQTHPPIIPKPITTGPHNNGIIFMPNETDFRGRPLGTVLFINKPPSCGAH